MSLTLQFRDATSVRKEIAIRGESIAIFSKRIGVNYSLMTEYLNNKKHPSRPTAKKIAKGLNKEIKDIFFI
ncbi:helix-turn-helix domain-containing protein [Leuconostoc mesenteroides]|uniref:helix-turn-helix domain-containing protein n=1 Tax=Leuconostoc mesenteroides TaxID=1245 RepID=UPI002361B102|nr:helix-turn-helix transcriptional regulator [Leuconostoc mesenteroides]